MSEQEEHGHGAWWKWMVWGCLFYLLVGMAFAGGVPSEPASSIVQTSQN